MNFTYYCWGECEHARGIYPIDDDWFIPGSRLLVWSSGGGGWDDDAETPLELYRIIIYYPYNF